MRNRQSGMVSGLIAGLAMLGWVASVIIRTANSVQINVVEEAPVVCLAVGVLYNRLAGHNGGSGPEGGTGT